MRCLPGDFAVVFAATHKSSMAHCVLELTPRLKPTQCVTVAHSVSFGLRRLVLCPIIQELQ